MERPRLQRLSLAFEDAELERAYLANREGRHSPRAYLTSLAVSAVAWLIFLAVGALSLPHLRWTLGAVVACMQLLIAVSAIVPFVVATQRPGRLMSRIVPPLNLIVGSLIPVVLAIDSQFLVLGAGALSLFVMALYTFMNLRFLHAAVISWTLAAVFVTIMLVSVMGENYWVAIGELLGAQVLGMRVGYADEKKRRRAFHLALMLEAERAKSERLLLNILPAPIAERLKASGESIAEHSDGVTVLFADIVGFTPLSARKTPQELVALLNRIFSEFDTLADAHGLEKIKTIGDAYMAVAGLPQPWPDHAPRAARMALAMRDATARVSAQTGEKLALRIGLHSGPVVAGVIGRRKFIYDLWGDTVNTASRMESHGLPGTIHCSEATALLLQGAFQLQARGAMEIKGKGEMHTFLLADAKGISNG